MDSAKNVFKSGWHPKKKQSWRSESKGINQIASLVGHGKDTSSSSASHHRPTSVSPLRDPASFAPPPKHTRYYSPDNNDGARGPLQQQPPPPPPRRTGDVTPLEKKEDEEEFIPVQHNGGASAGEVRSKPAPPPIPARANTSASLPPPSVIPSLPPRRSTPEKTGIKGSTGVREPPLPPRLPPRAQTHSSATELAKQQPGVQSTTFGTLRGRVVGDQGGGGGAYERLSKAGVSVPALGIGTAPKPAIAPPVEGSPATGEPTSESPSAARPGLQQLTTRFSRLSATPSSPSSAASGPAAVDESPPQQGTTIAQKRQALQTLSALHNNPASVRASDVRAAASTANNFRQRHGAQVAQGWQVTNELNSKYGLVDKVAQQASGQGPPLAQPTSNEPVQAVPSTVFKTPPPPPPPKRK